ncbi:MAG: gas vesicle protein GvpG [Pseudomonadota bacterium]
MLFRLLTAPVKGPIDLVVWTGKKIQEAADGELNNPEKIKKELVSLENRLDRGELSEEEFEALELELITRLRDISKNMRETSEKDMPQKQADASRIKTSKSA